MRVVAVLCLLLFSKLAFCGTEYLVTEKSILNANKGSLAVCEKKDSNDFVSCRMKTSIKEQKTDTINVNIFDLALSGWELVGIATVDRKQIIYFQQKEK